MSTRIMDEAARVFADPQAYADEAKLHAALTHLRANAPVSWVDVPDYRPFWAITKHADIMDIERANTLFTNSPRPVLATVEGDEQQAAIGVSTLIHMDDPQHRAVRAIGADWFRPKAMRALKVRIDELAKRYVDHMLAGRPRVRLRSGGRGELPAVRDHVDARCTRIRLPAHAEVHAGTVRQATMPSFSAGTTKEEQMVVLLEMFEYFNELTASRRENPTEDLASAIANATIDGEPLSDIDTVSYYLIIATAGHDTTSATIAGGLHALIENPDQRERLRANMDLMPLATEEMIRWVTPVKEFMRTAREDTSIRGVPIAAGESVLLSYVVKQPRRRGLRRSVPVRRRSRTEQAQRVRLRRALLPRRGAGPDGGQQLLLRTDSETGVDRTDRRPRAHRDDLRRWAQAPADSLLVVVGRLRLPRAATTATRRRVRVASWVCDGGGSPGVVGWDPRISAGTKGFGPGFPRRTDDVPAIPHRMVRRRHG